MEITIIKKNKYDIIYVSGNVDIYNAYKLRDSIANIFDGEKKVVAVDLKHVDYMDSSGIGALFVGQKKMAAVNGKFALININSKMLHILEQSHLDKYFPIYKSEEELAGDIDKQFKKPDV